MIQNIIWGQAKTCTETGKIEFSGMASYSQVFKKKKTQNSAVLNLLDYKE